ncbi:hypothetical protein E3J79_02965 [Candidatus Dependentiae bacterium]|nr:MAG: hypothetical protein E3J79_02965 [Candidatus Dependentiae bacterium]
MIKRIFVPEKIGSYYLFPKRIIGFDIGKTIVHACLVHLHGYAITIEKCFEERIVSGENASYPERTGKAIRSIIDAAGRYNSIYSAIDSSRIVFKKLTLPFIQYDKIKKVIYFEVEPLLPFPLHEAIVDFIIIDQNIKEGKSEVLAAAVQHEQLDQHLQLFAEAEVSPEVVTVDLFALYGLYCRIPSYMQLEGDVALIDLGISATRIAYITDGKLSFIRTVPKGISAVAKIVGSQIGVSLSDAIERIMRFGLEGDDSGYNDAINKALTTFWYDLSFTLRSFSMRTEALSIHKILLLGIGSEIKGLSPFVNQLLNISCETFTVTGLFQDKNVILKQNQRIASSTIISLSVALPSPVTERFNLYQEEQRSLYASVVNKQLIAALVLVTFLFGLLLIHSFLQVRKLRHERVSSEKEAVRVLKERFPTIEENRLGDVVEESQKAIKEEEERIALMSPARVSSLNYLLELIARIDKKALGFVVERITIGDGVLVLKGKVKDFDALRKLEASLRESKLFNYTESQEKTEFDAKIELVQNFEEI